MRSHTVPALFLVTAATTAGGGVDAASAQPILPGYAGAFIGNEDYKRFLPLLRDQGLNSVDIKIQPPDFDVQSKEVEAYITRVVREAHAHGLRVFLNLYPEGKGQRDPARPASGPFVGEDGIPNEHLYCLYQAEAWQSMFRRVFYLARLSRTLPSRR